MIVFLRWHVDWVYFMIGLMWKKLCLCSYYAVSSMPLFSPLMSCISILCWSNNFLLGLFFGAFLILCGSNYLFSFFLWRKRNSFWVVIVHCTMIETFNLCGSNTYLFVPFICARFTGIFTIVKLGNLRFERRHAKKSHDVWNTLKKNKEFQKFSHVHNTGIFLFCAMLNYTSPKSTRPIHTYLSLLKCVLLNL